MTTNETMTTHKTAARIFGVFFLISFLTYASGSALIDSIVSAPDMLANVYANQTLLVVAALLMAVIHTCTNIGLPVTLLRVLKPHNETLYVGYLSAAIVATVSLAIGVIFLLVLLPLSDAYMRSGSASPEQFATMAILLRKVNFFSYNLGMVMWSVGGLLFCAILYQAKLIPRFMSVWGAVGYVVFLSGCMLELFGLDLSSMHTLPGAVFEIGLSGWLIVKGFNASVITSESAKTDSNERQRALSAT